MGGVARKERGVPLVAPSGGDSTHRSETWILHLVLLVTRFSILARTPRSPTAPSEENQALVPLLQPFATFCCSCGSRQGQVSGCPVARTEVSSLQLQGFKVCAGGS